MPVSGGSRHRFSPAHVARDAAGVPHATLGIRALEAVAPGLLHRVEAGDTLETLAFAYLGASEEWWRIADCNPVACVFGLTPGSTVVIPGETASGTVVRTRSF
jgi:nucleoid-associated protein YgaU